MNISYTGKTKEFSKSEQSKLDARFARLGKVVERKGEKKAQVVITSTRHLQKAEIRMQFEEHPLVGIASDPDLFQAVSAAVDKLEKQALKLRAKIRDYRPETRKAVASPVKAAPLKTSTNPKAAGKGKAAPATGNGLAAVVAEANGKSSKSAKIFRITAPHGPKPMTLEEAMLEIERDDDYYVYLDAQSGSQHVLIRRSDGHFDLIEG